MTYGDEDTSSGFTIELSEDDLISAAEPEAPAPAAADERTPAPAAVAPRFPDSAARVDLPPSPSLVRAREESHRDGIRATLRQILPALDSLESCYREATDQQSLQQGVRMALREMWDVFRAHELERIEGDGTAFDPRFHEAVQVTETSRVPSGTVLEVLRVGYTLAGELVRPAMVRVAIAPGGPAAGDPQQEENR